MNNSDQLFILIQSLNSSEKIYFKRYAKKEDTNYLKLFDAIASQKNYDEEKIVKKFSKEKFSKHIRVAKSRLFKSVLKSLQEYHYEFSDSATLKNILKSVEILYKKGLFDLCHKLLSSAKKSIIDHSLDGSMNSVMFEIIQWERNLLHLRSKDVAQTESEIILLKKEEEQYLKIFSNNRDYIFLSDRMNLIIRRGIMLPDKELINTIDQLITHPLLSNEKKALSLFAKIAYNTFFQQYYYIKKDLLSSIKNAKRAIELVEKNTTNKKRNSEILIDKLFSLGLMLYSIKYYSEVFSTINKIQSISVPESAIHLKIKKFISITLLSLSTHNIFGEYQRAADLSSEIISKLNIYKNKISLTFLVDIYFELAHTYFGLNDFKTSMKWINKVLNEKKAGKGDGLVILSKILSAVIHVEIKDDDLIESDLRSLTRVFENEKNRYPIEILFIKSLKEISKKKSNKINVIEKLLQDSNRLLKNSNDSISKTNYEVLIQPWLESKIQKKSFQQIVREKVKPFLK